MITIKLDAEIVEDVKCIEELRSLGFSDEYIQKIYDLTKNRKDKDEETKADNHRDQSQYP